MRTPLLLCLLPSLLLAASPYPEKTPDTLGNRLIDRYFAEQAREITADNGLAQIQTAADWEAKAPEYRRQMFEMLGLDPLPEKTLLHATKTGELKGDGFVVEKLHFQSMPGLYVTANLYLPEKVEKPLPTILYVCGHANVVKEGVSMGNKTGYEHHGVWYARHGYACLIIDTVQLGEIRGEHHGTYSKGRWWWFSRGYTPAGLRLGAAYAHSTTSKHARKWTRPASASPAAAAAAPTPGGSPRWMTASKPALPPPASPTCRIRSSTAASKATATACSS